MRTNWLFRWINAASALGGCAIIVAACQPAAAHQRHWHHVTQHALGGSDATAPATSGFGPTAPGISSIVIDATTGQVISAIGADIPRYPASLTKLMTLDLAFQAISAGRLSLDTEIPVSEHAADVEPVKLGLRPGGEISVRQAILAMTTMSANDAATALGEYLGGGSEIRCAQMMTLRAHALGMAQTEFYNASGLPNPNQITTARDLAILARDIVVNDQSDQPFFEVQEFNFYGHSIYSNNQMLKTYPGATGMKTGYTDLARHNLVTSATRNGHVLIGVVLHEPSWGTAYHQMTAMLDSGFGGHVAGSNATYAANTPAIITAPPNHAAPPSAAPAPVLAANADNNVLAHRIWMAQLGPYNRLSRARIMAIHARRIQGTGVARVAKLTRHGHVLWSAQLAGLTFDAAHQTCDVLATSHCRVIGPTADHLAAAARTDISGT